MSTKVARLASLTMIALVLCGRLACANEPGLAVEVDPSPLKLLAVPAQAALTVTNETEVEVRQVVLSWFTDSGLDVSVDDPNLQSLPAGAQHAWPLKISYDGGEIGTFSAHFRIDYQVAEGRKLTPRVAITSLTVDKTAAESVEEVASAELKTALETLTERQPGRVYLILKNLSNAPLQVGPVESDLPHVALTPVGSAGPWTLGAAERRAVSFEVRAESRVRPGKHLIFLEIPVAWEKWGQARSGSMFLAQEVQIGVLGESEILTLLGVPSFLLLPGFLWLVTVGLMYRRKVFLGGGESVEFPLEASKPEFWLVAVSFSILMAVVYPVIFRHDYLESYGLADIVRVWLISVFVCGVGFYLIAMAVSRGVGVFVERYKRELVPSEDDKPLQVFEKLDRIGLSLRLHPVKFSKDGRQYRGFLLHPSADSPTERDLSRLARFNRWILRDRWREGLWVAPAAVLEFESSASDALQEAVQDELNTSASPAAIRELLKESTQFLKLDWDRTIDSFRNPERVGADAQVERGVELMVRL